MVTENFLINPSRTNPPRKLRRKVKTKWKDTSWLQGKTWVDRSKSTGKFTRIKKLYYGNPIGEVLTVIGANPSYKNPWFGHSAGHRRAALIRWGKVRRKKVATKRKVKRARHTTRRVVHRVARRRSIDRRSRAYRMERKKQESQLKGFLGLTSGKKRRFKRVSGTGLWAKRNPFGRSGMKHRRRRNTWFGQPRRHKRAAKRGWRSGHMVPFHHTKASKRRRIRHRNPMASANPRRRRHKVGGRRRHRNPAIGKMMSRFTGGVMNVRHWAPLAVTGGLSAVTGAVVPGMLGVTGFARLGVQTAVAFGGGILVEQVAGKEHGQAWTIVGLAMVGYQVLKEYVLQPYFPQFAVGLGAISHRGYDEYYPETTSSDVSQRIDAFPSAMHAFPGVSAYPGVGDAGMGSYPYDGAGY